MGSAPLNAEGTQWSAGCSSAQPSSAAQPGASLLSCFVSHSEAGDVFSAIGSSIIPLFFYKRWTL